MKFKVYDNKTGKEANVYEIALHEEWARSLVYCDMEGFAITEDGDLVLMDECGNVVYCDADRFEVIFEGEVKKGKLTCLTCGGCGFCDTCDHKIDS